MGAGSDADKVIERFDIGMYHPEAVGLRDLAFKIRISKLAEMLNSKKVLGEIKDIYFSIYWLFPDTYKIEVYGLPPGFEAIKSELKQIVRTRLDFVIPERLTNRFFKYNLKLKRMATGVEIEGTDPTGKLDTNRVVMHFENNGKLSSLNTYAPGGIRTSKLQMESRNDSNGKWLVTNMEILLKQGNLETKMEYDLNYSKYQGFLLPELLGITTVDGSGKEAKSNRTEITFYDYKVNEKIAEKEINK